MASFLRFLMVGGLFSVIFSATTAALISLAGAPPVATGVLVWLACIPPAYYCQRRFAFGVKRTRRMAFPLYAATQGASLALVSGASALLVTRDFWADTGVYLLASAAAAVMSFLIGRFVTFAPPAPAG